VLAARWHQQSAASDDSREVEGVGTRGEASAGRRLRVKPRVLRYAADGNRQCQSGMMSIPALVG
jgi:hypothetical protein